MRALEVVELTGRPFSASLPEPVYAVPALQLGIGVGRAELDRLVAERVDRMWAGGLLAEVAALGPRMGRTAARAVGYAQALRVVAGEDDAEAARADTVTATRRLARRQMTWFGRDPRVHWLPAGPELVERALALVAAADAGRLPDPPVRRRTLGP